jgi:3-oxoadipate enol-lactonase
MFVQGSGPPLVVIPGVQGRWEWFRPGLDALSKYCRTVSYSLCGDSGSGARFAPADGFDNFVRQLDGIFERCQIARAALCGVSYGGFIAVRYAAVRPDRVSAVVLASAPSPGWTPNTRQQRYLASPWRSAPSFILTSPGRLFPEIHAAYDTWPQRIGFAAAHAARAAFHPLIPSRVAQRVAVQQSTDMTADCQAVRAPALVIAGEPDLDRVVPVSATRRYADLIPNARFVTLERTGHLGIVTRPRRFAELVGEFVNDATHS